MQRILATELVRRIGETRHGLRLGRPPPAAQVGRQVGVTEPEVRARIEELPEEASSS